MPFTDEEVRLIRDQANAHALNVKLDEYQQLVSRSDGHLRDMFAGQALAGMLANPERIGNNAKFEGWAFQAYRFADAMMAERKK